MAGRITVLSSQAIEAALVGVTRQYLVGNLKNPQPLRHIDHDAVEIGITRYVEDGITEAPHTHKKAYEFQYMLSGTTAYRDVDSGEELIFTKGDFYMIEPGVAYAQKSAAGTAILFIKIPPGNDKINLATAPETELWFRERLQGDGS